MARVQLPKCSLAVSAILPLVGLSVFSWLPLSYYRMVSWPWCLIWQLSFLLLVGVLVVQLRSFHQPFRPLGRGLDLLVVLTAAGLAASSVGSEFKPVALLNCLLPAGYGVLLYGGRNLVLPRIRHRLWLALVALAGITAVVSLSQWRPDPAMWQDDSFYSAIRNPFPLGHHNFVGGYFALMLPLTVSLAMAWKGWRRWLGIGAAIASAAALYVSGSRGAMLGSVIWLTVAALAWAVRARGQQLLRRGLAASGLLALTAGIAASNPRVRDLVEGINLVGSAPVSDGPTLDRWFMLRMAANILRDHPLLGVGPGTLARVSNLYRPLETGTGLDHIQQLHNLPAQLLAELGILGGMLYIGWLLGVGYLGGRIWRKPLSAVDRKLLLGIAGSGLAYGMSSLTDYQLENIAIALPLTLLVWMLVDLADDVLGPPQPLAQRRRRFFSLGVFGLAGLMVYAWIPADLSLSFGQSGLRAFQQHQIITAENRWQKSIQIAPWDPTFSAVASQEILDVSAATAAADDRTPLQNLALEYAQKAQAAAPNDAWFNQNLAVLLQQEDPAQAITYAARAAQLLPRNRNYTYFLLGQLYLAQNQVEQALAAFALEALVRPEVLTYPIWETAPLNQLRNAVFDLTLSAYDHLLATVPSTARGYSSLLEVRVLLSWWFDQPVELSPDWPLRSIVRAVAMVDSNPKAALALMEAIAEQSSAERLLAAWLAPSRYLDAYLSESSRDEPALLQQTILEHRDFSSWLRSDTYVPDRMVRGALAYAYRNQAANQIRLMLRPQGLRGYSMISQLGLFPQWPREFPALDWQIETMRREWLDLPHSTQRAISFNTH